MTRLTVVLISKNQAWNIARLIESVLRETMRFPETEIVLADSASEDRTIELAQKYPIRILRLRPDQPLGASAGRYVGYKNTSGDVVLFLDGDMELCEGWLDISLRVIEDVPDVAVVTGQRVDLPRGARPSDKPLPKSDDTGLGVVVPQGGGAALYRRSALERVGAFNPYLHAEEEPELCLRIRHAGYRILQLRHPIVYHYTAPEDAVSTLINRRRSNYFSGGGQVMRLLWGGDLFWTYVGERGYGCLPALALAVGMTSFLASLGTRQWIWFGSWVLASVVIIAGYGLRRRSFCLVFFSLIHRLFILEGMLRGFLMKPTDPNTYHAKFDVIK